jgi:hypothetical protein
MSCCRKQGRSTLARRGWARKKPTRTTGASSSSKTPCQYARDLGTDAAVAHRLVSNQHAVGLATDAAMAAMSSGTSVRNR